MRTSYPPEIWRVVFDHADQLTLRQASLVCNAFRDIAQSITFQSVTFSDANMTNPAPNPQMPFNFKSHAEVLHKTSWVTSNSRILSFIRELSFVFMMPETPEFHKTFALWAAVLPKMYLTTFKFMGIVLPEIMHQPLRNQRTLRTLASPSLVGCRLPCYLHPKYNHTGGNLVELELVNTFGDRYDPRYGFIGPRPCTTLSRFLFEHTHTLVRLQLDAQMLYEALFGVYSVPCIPQLTFLRIDEPPAVPDTPLALTFAFIDAFANFAIKNSSVKELVWLYHSGIVLLPLRLSPDALPNLQRFGGAGIAAPCFTTCANVISFELEFRAVLALPPLPVAPRNASTTEEILETLGALKESASSAHTLEIALPQFDSEIFPVIMGFSGLRTLKLTGPLGLRNDEVCFRTTSVMDSERPTGSTKSAASSGTPDHNYSLRNGKASKT